MTEEADFPEAILLMRMTKEHAGACVQCGDAETLPAKKPRLYVEFKECYITLCPLHEGELLERLLRNYIKRKERGSKVGWIGPLTKDDDGFDADGEASSDFDEDGNLLPEIEVYRMGEKE